MPGRIAISMEREPNFFAEEKAWPASDALPSFRQTIVARAEGEIVGAGSCTFHQRFINGHPRRVGYLNGLRLNARFSGRFGVARRGYRCFEELQHDFPADCYFTTIAADNQRPRRVLERGLPGMPRYHYVCDYVTALIPVRRSATKPARNTPSESQPGLRADLSEMLNRHSRDYQLAPCWTAERLLALQGLGLDPENFTVVWEAGLPIACAALWDQRGFKQTVIRDYARALRSCRPLINLVSRWLSRPGLPEPNRPLAQAVLSHLATPAERPELVLEIVKRVLRLGVRQGIEFLTIGFAEKDPRLGLLRRSFAAREYRTRLYQVQWPDLPFVAWDGRVPFPEVALL
jgi:hypothetical protein